MWFRTFSVCAFAFVAVLCISRARADMANYVVEPVCNAKTETAVVAIEVTYNDDAGPDGSIDAERLSNPTVVCDFGRHGRVAVKAWMSGDHPRDDNLEIDVNGASVYDLLGGPEDTPKKITVRFSETSPPRFCLNDDPLSCKDLSR